VGDRVSNVMLNIKLRDNKKQNTDIYVLSVSVITAVHKRNKSISAFSLAPAGRQKFNRLQIHNIESNINPLNPGPCYSGTIIIYIFTGTQGSELNLD